MGLALVAEFLFHKVDCLKHYVVFGGVHHTNVDSGCYHYFAHEQRKVARNWQCGEMSHCRCENYCAQIGESVAKHLTQRDVNELV